MHVLRHSAAHLLAMAVMELFPGTDLGFGPATDEGFYYDFKTPQQIVEDDLPKIEARMQAIVKEGRPFARSELDKDGAKVRLADVGYHLKVPHIDDIPGEVISFYDSGSFTDMCEGPHVPDTSWIAPHQAALRQRRLLARRCRRRADAAHPRHGVLRQEGPEGASGAHRASQVA